MRRVKCLGGQRFGRWYVLSQADFRDGSTNAFWRCRCDCGTISEVKGSQLTSGKSLSCGCITAEVNAARMLTHGQTRTPEFKAWQAMNQRCYNPKCKEYPRYGGRGIYVCEAWRDSFITFLADVGHRPNRYLSIDRINNNGGYYPGNVRWATKKQQANNRSNSKRSAS